MKIVKKLLFVCMYVNKVLASLLITLSGADTGFRKRGGAGNSGRKTAGGNSRDAVSPPSGVWGIAPGAFAIRAFTSTRIANNYGIIPSDFAL